MRNLNGRSLDPQLWHACAGAMVQIPPINSIVFYFPQGHLEHSQSHPSCEFPFPKSISSIPSFIPCRVAAISYLADAESDEVYTKIGVIPFPNSNLDMNSINEYVELEEKAMLVKSDNLEKPASFAKTLTQSDANNGGGFSVPRYCAETIFPRLDYSAEPPVQTVMAKDVHGEVWKFRHIYRGTPRRHLLTTGWSTFVNQKKLIAGDSIVFLRSENGELRVGIRRAKRSLCIQNPPGFWMEDEAKRNVKGVRIQDVLEATVNAINGKPFEVVYYPRASTPEFFVRVAAVREAMRMRWCPGMRFKMAFETEDSSRISWFMGTVASVQVSDPIRWPNSPWRLLQVTWDEPDLLQNVKRVNPWLVELVSNIPPVHVSPYSPPRKKLRLPPMEPPFELSPLTNATTAASGIQGTRHHHHCSMLLSDVHLSNKLFLSTLKSPSPQPTKESLSCLLTMGNSGTNSKKSGTKEHPFLLFGQPILTEQQLSRTRAVEEGLIAEKSGKAKFLDVLQISAEKTAAKFPWQQRLCAFVSYDSAISRDLLDG